ncbi:hypothetical protein B9Z55_007812 [Caenorhabditis nigoni]|uniref:BTB domain-containing protein n=1 Tax=Caenorhabditis nigoni TaxID=1611254 RepID=A0A2G5VBB7_9PELO|nr:hypothetical protein B9Z55_007812 [Caenorhabditis nigoni]
MQKTQLMVDYTVEGILQIADMYETPLAVKKCENYLIKGSKLGSKKMLELAEKYRLEELKFSDSMTEREFTLKYIFKDVGELKDGRRPYSPEEEHFRVNWKIEIRKKENHLAMYLHTNVIENQQVHVDYTMKIISKNKGKTHLKSATNVFEKQGDPLRDNWGWHKFIEWKTVEEEYLDDGKLEVESHVKITKMIGFTREKLRSFGEETKQFSDVILKVMGRKFYVSKLSLSSQSPYFATLFLGQFQESGKSEIELKDVNPEDLQCYLEVIYLEDAIDETTVLQILTVADMYDTPIIVKKCEKFLVKESEMELKKKLELAGKYRLEELRKVCLDQIKTKEDIQTVVPENLDEMDREILGELFKKTLSLI